MSQLDVTRRGRIAVMALNRPEHRNRISQQMAEELTAALEKARTDPAIGACVLTGSGDVFCLGGDYQGAGPTTAGRMEFARAFRHDPCHVSSRQTADRSDQRQRPCRRFSIVIACDLAIVADDATLGLPETAKGLFPFLALAVVKDALPKKVLFDIVYNARLMSAKEACTLHLANEAVPQASVLDRAVEAAERASSHNANILMLGRDLYYSMRCLGPSEALEKSRFALGVALAAQEPKSQ